MGHPTDMGPALQHGAASPNDRLVVVTAVAWTPQVELDMGDWLRYGNRFGLLGRTSGWWIGDWVNFGNRAYGEKYRRAAQATKYDAQTLMNMAYVASRFEISRRRENLTWSHHAELAALLVEAQELWLDRVEQERLTVRDLRLELRRARGRALGASAPNDAQSRRPSRSKRGSWVAQTLRCPNCGQSVTDGGARLE